MQRTASQPLLLHLLLVLLLLPLLSNCGKSHSTKSSASCRPDREQPSISGQKIPATQRPYRIDNTTYYPIPSADGFAEKGIASWYGPGFHGRKTSNGETYDMHAMTAAHKTLPMDTQLLVKNLDNGLQTVVRINDRGPFVDGRVVDLSLTAAERLDIVRGGTARVQIAAINGDQRQLVENQQPAPAVLPRHRQDYYYVRVDSFADQATAEKVQQRFASFGHETLLRRNVPEQRGFTVFVYVGQDAKQAKQAEAKLIQLGYKQASVVSASS